MNDHITFTSSLQPLFVGVLHSLRLLLTPLTIHMIFILPFLFIMLATLFCYSLPFTGITLNDPEHDEQHFPRPPPGELATPEDFANLSCPEPPPFPSHMSVYDYCHPVSPIGASLQLS
jgi:hypothetical protein